MDGVKVKVENDDINLFDFLLRFGPNLIEGHYHVINDDESNATRELLVYKVILEEWDVASDLFYKFSPEGHNFYLKALIMRSNDIRE